MNGEFDVLVATTIIESGLDVPNANTIFTIMLIILVCLTCIRCEVGKKQQEGVFILSPPYSAMTDDARKRIQALEQFSDLGAVLISP
jgi:transcription-repair coupling factor (superfamily II helicase)